MNSPYKVGVLDSGIGGLSILSEILQQAPDIDLYYFADDKFAPYGDLSIELLQERSLKICEYLINKGIDAIVVACNTATVVSIEFIRQSDLLKQCSIPVIGVEPAVKPASLKSISGNITVLATPVTCKSERLGNLIEKEIQTSRVENRHLQFTCLESKTLALSIDLLPQSLNETEEEVVNIRNVMCEQNSDTLVLACTHYPLIIELFKKHLGQCIQIIESSNGVTTQLLQRLQYHPTLPTNGNVYLFSTGNEKYASRLLDWVKKLNQQQLQKKAVVLKANINI